MISSPFLSKLFSKPVLFILFFFILLGLFLYIRFPHVYYDNLIDWISDLLKKHYSTGGAKAKIDSGMNKLALLIMVLSFAVFLYLLFWKWLFNKLKEGEQIFSFPTKIHIEKKDWIIIILLTIVAILLRIFPIFQGLWQDEIGQYNTFIKPGIMASVFPKSSMGSHPLMQIIVSLFTQITGVTEFTLRFPVFLIAIFSVPLMYIICLKISGQKLIATIAAAILTIHSYHIYYSFQMKGYVILVFLCIISIYLLLKILFSPQNRKIKILYIITSVLIVYTHLYALFLILAQQLAILVALLYQKYAKGNSPIFLFRNNIIAYFHSFIVSMFIAFLLYLPQFPAIFMTILDTTKGEPGYSIITHIYDVVASSNFVIAYSDLVLICYFYALLICLLFILFIKNSAYQVIFFIGIILFLITAIIPSGSGFSPRYMICEVPLFIIISAIVLGELWLSAKMLHKSIAVVLTISYLTITVFSFPKTHQTIQDYRGAVQFIAKQPGENKIILSISLGKTEIPFYNNKILPVKNYQEFDSLCSSYNEIYVVYSYDEFIGFGFFKNDLEIYNDIKKRFRLIKTFEGEFPVKVWYYNNNQHDD